MATGRMSNNAQKQWRQAKQRPAWHNKQLQSSTKQQLAKENGRNKNESHLLHKIEVVSPFLDRSIKLNLLTMYAT